MFLPMVRGLIDSVSNEGFDTSDEESEYQKISSALFKIETGGCTGYYKESILYSCDLSVITQRNKCGYCVLKEAGLVK